MSSNNQDITTENNTINKKSSLIIDDSVPKMINPSLPPLYFEYQEKKQVQGLTTANGYYDITYPLLCSEIETTIFSYLTWGDHARLATTHSRFANILHDAAKQSDDAKWTIAQCFLRGGNELEEHPELAIDYLKDLADTTLDCEDKITPSVVDHDDVNIESNESSPLLNSVASKSRYATEAMKQLSKCYLEGTGVQKEADKGMGWFQQAYKYGDLDAAYEIAAIYEHGKYGIEIDIYNAARWFHTSAIAGHVESMAEYAMCLEIGCGVDQCDQQALDWYTKAAEKGHVTSNYSVGEMFESARGGLPQSDTEAVLWYYKAAMLGDEDSKKALKRLNDIARIVVPGWAATLNV